MPINFRFYFISFLLMISQNHLLAQARIIINNNAIMTMDNGVYLVVDNGNTNAITTAGTGGNIISEEENNKIKWHIGTNTGTYTVPFTSLIGVKIPLDMVVTTAGTGAGFVEFSTYAGATWDNETYMPSTVTNMTNGGVTNNSAEVIDRFWIMSTNGYTTRPAGSFNFTYRDAEHTAVGNSITEAQLKAERYAAPTNSWDFYAPVGVDDAVNNKVNGATFTAANFYPVWTLIDQAAHPLPIVLTDFSATCSDKGTILHWSTSNEQNSKSFIIYESVNGVNFSLVAQVDAAGNSTEQIDYSLLIPSGGEKYYRLQLINADASANDFGLVYANCETPSQPAFYAYASAAYTLQVVATNLPDGAYQLQLFNLTGALCNQQEVNIEQGNFIATMQDNKLASGIYIVRLTNNSSVQFQQKVYLRDF
ncbi:MAG: T9SS type A sorting domain-containing protein [Bacteroidetes bacterium]|nr:T9SS type A sorting domain-containing protein [Bacteroidota bacterium]